MISNKLSTSDKYFIFPIIRRRKDAYEFKVFRTHRCEVVNGSWRNIDQISGLDQMILFGNGHLGLALDYIINLISKPVVMGSKVMARSYLGKVDGGFFPRPTFLVRTPTSGLMGFSFAN